MKTKILRNPFLIIGFALMLIISCNPKILSELNTMKLVGKRGIVTHTYDVLKPFENSYLNLPPGYTGPTYELKHDYADVLPPPADYPWKKVTNNGPITPSISLAYVEALKEYVSPDMRKILYNAPDADELDWYQSIWLGSQREPVHGTYVGSPFPAKTLAPDQEDLTTFVYTLYDETSSVTLNKIWGTDLANAENPNLTNVADAQYAEGSVIIKFAFVTDTKWSAMDGAAIWNIYTDVKPGESNAGTSPKEFRDLALMQFDIIVKDSEAAPKTGWVFSTLVYDKTAPGKDAWDKMIPLGATWGNDPEINNTNPSALNAPVTVNTNLKENWINPNTPTYSRSTLGWDGRLSGPNDGAVVSPALTTHGVKYDNLATVGCFGCHSTAQHQFKSFLLPSPGTFDPKTDRTNPTVKNGMLVIHEPGFPDWRMWFEDRDGKTPIDEGPGQIGLDYDMVTAFKALPLWKQAINDKANNENLQ